MTNNTNEVLNHLLDCISDIIDYDEEIDGKTTFEEMELESLDFIELQTMVKKKYGIQITAKDFTENEIVNLSGLAGLIGMQIAA